MEPDLETHEFYLVKYFKNCTSWQILGLNAKLGLHLATSFETIFFTPQVEKHSLKHPPLGVFWPKLTLSSRRYSY